MTFKSVWVEGLITDIDEYGNVTLRASSEGKKFAAPDFVKWFNRVNTAIRDAQYASAVVYQGPCSVRVLHEAKGFTYTRRYSPPWRQMPVTGSYWVNIDLPKVSKYGYSLALDRPSWEHIVSGYYRYKESTEWFQKRNRQRNAELSVRMGFTGSGYRADYYRAALRYRPESAAKFVWDDNQGGIVVRLLEHKGVLVGFTAAEFEEIIAAVETRLQEKEALTNGESV